MGLRSALRRQVELERRGVSATVLTAGAGRDILRNSPDGWEVEQPGLWFVPPGDGSDWTVGNPPPGAGDPGGFRTLPAVQRCTALIVDVIAGLPWQVLRGDWDVLPTPAWIGDPQHKRPDDRVKVGGTPLSRSGLLDDARMSAVEFWSTWITSALWWGDGYVYAPVRDANGDPAPPLWILHPYEVTIRDGGYWVNGDTEGPLPPGTIMHLRGGRIHADGYGTGVLREHACDLGVSLAVRSYTAQQYRSGIPAGYIESSQPNLTREDAQALQAAWEAQHGGRRRIAVLNATTKFTPIAISAIDSQLASAREWSLRDIAMMFGVPSYLLDVPGDSSTYANVESRMVQYRMLTLLNPWVRRIESCLDSEFPNGTSVKIKTAGLERADTATRYAAHKIAIEAGFMTTDEVRALEDLPPLGASAVVPVPAPNTTTP